MGQWQPTLAPLVTRPFEITVKPSSLGGSAVAIFDLDGTLVDSWHEVHSALLLTLEGLDVQCDHLQALEPMTDLSAAELLTFCGLPGDDHLPDAVALFRSNLAAIIGTSVRLMDGAEETLESLSETGYSLAVATNKPESLALRTLEVVGIAHRFSLVVGTERFPAKPAPDMLLACLADTASARGFLVGDSVKDLGAACNAGLPVFLVGSVAHESLESPSGADVTRLAQLRDIIDIVDR